MNDQAQWIPGANAIVVHYIAPARELLAPDMPAVDPAQLARASELIEQHRQNASPSEDSMTWTDCPRCPTSYVRQGNPGCPMCERLPCWWLEVATRIMPQGSFRCFVGDEEREHDQVRITTSARELTATRESFLNNGVVAALFTELAGALVSDPTRNGPPSELMSKWTAHYWSRHQRYQHDFPTFESAMGFLGRELDNGTLSPIGVAEDDGPVRDYMELWPKWFYAAGGPADAVRRG